MSAQLSPTYYEILGISPSAIDDMQNGESSTHFIRRAYRRALLVHHPDKQQQTSTANHPKKPTTTKQTITTTTTTPQPQYTIDQISQALAVLSNPTQRAHYDRQLKLLLTSPSSSSTGITTQTLFQTGIENVDLDDLASEETATTQWYRPCRCGNPRGYLFSEDDLEEAADLGELMVGCADCSLWLRVHFAVVEEEGDEDGEEERGGAGQEVR